MLLNFGTLVKPFGHWPYASAISERLILVLFVWNKVQSFDCYEYCIRGPTTLNFLPEYLNKFVLCSKGLSFLFSIACLALYT